jgi:hypothetical protein
MAINPVIIAAMARHKTRARRRSASWMMAFSKELIVSIVANQISGAK